MVILLAFAIIVVTGILVASPLLLRGLVTPEAQTRIRAALSNGFQTRPAELNLPQLLADLPVS